MVGMALLVERITMQQRDRSTSTQQTVHDNRTATIKDVRLE
jgi:hypothetical protein